MAYLLSHPIPAGTKVFVHNIVLKRRPFGEGEARIVAPVTNGSDIYRVRFEGERIDQVRAILGGPFQRYPEECIAALRAQWLASFLHAHHLQMLLRSDEGRL